MPERASTLFTLGLGLGLLSALAAFPAAAEDPIRITQLKRCGDLFAEDSLSWCLSAKGLPRGGVQLYLNGE
ncbi:MAG TPA: peptidase S8 and S53 subtilisin kexin sedolisin, partial [Pseudomonas sp.]|nr:peptidase S8 and S53 subtilisin kexin sedolisin [Pseudomonas sp.]